MVTKHSCSKERELGIMATKIENIDNNVNELKRDVKNFIESSNKIYATKEEVKNSIEGLKKVNDRQDADISWSKNKLFDVVYKIGMVVGILYLLFKVQI